MTTIGYGDFYPRTTPGRIITFFLAIWGVIITSLTVIALDTFVQVTERQKKAFHMIKSMKIRDNITNTASSLIANIYRAYRLKGSGTLFESIRVEVAIRKCKESFLQFRGATRELRNHLTERSIYDVLIFENDTIRYQLDENIELQDTIMESAKEILEKVNRLKKESLNYQNHNSSTQPNAQQKRVSIFQPAADNSEIRTNLMDDLDRYVEKKDQRRRQSIRGGNLLFNQR